MARIGLVLVLGVVISIMAVSMYMYVENKINIIEVNSGDKVKVGPVEYTITFEGTHNGNKETKAENMFVHIGIVAKNISEERTLMSEDQFYILEDKKKYVAVYGEFSSKDLLSEWLEPGKAIEKTTQFDIPFDEEKQYNVIIRPQKEQTSVDTAVVCITNCE
ncbi:MAG: DUF4352 domain-containing protein [Nitrosopumilus sp.]|nr:DUF4352 domain-containing protein [Nitrosopumilus sp.]